MTREQWLIGNRAAPYAALVLRLSLAGFFFAHVYRKFAIIGFDNWWNGLTKAGYADWMLHYTLVAESAGAVLLLLGIYSRYVSLLALPVLVAVTHHWAIRKGFWFGDGGAEFPLAWTNAGRASAAGRWGVCPAGARVTVGARRDAYRSTDNLIISPV
jgi:putative oxidoreductase